MLLLDLVCSLSLLIAAILDSSVPLVNIIDLLKYGKFAGKYEVSMKYGSAFGGVINFTCIGYPHQDLAQILA